MSEYIMGLDLSLTAPGMAMIDGIEVMHPKTRGVQRLILIRDWVLDGIGGRTTTVYLEGYAYGRHNQAHQLGELGGVIRVALAERNVNVAVVPPATLKQFATGKGNAGKADMLLAAMRAGYADDSADDNAIDAYWLRQFGLFADAFYEVPQTQYRHGAVGSWLTKREAA
jgi:hypothetical protein